MRNIEFMGLLVFRLILVVYQMVSSIIRFWVYNIVNIRKERR